MYRCILSYWIPYRSLADDFLLPNKLERSDIRAHKSFNILA